MKLATVIRRSTANPILLGLGLIAIVSIGFVFSSIGALSPSILDVSQEESERSLLDSARSIAVLMEDTFASSRRALLVVADAYFQASVGSHNLTKIPVGSQWPSLTTMQALDPPGTALSPLTKLRESSIGSLWFFPDVTELSDLDGAQTQLLQDTSITDPITRAARDASGSYLYAYFGEETTGLIRSFPWTNLDASRTTPYECVQDRNNPYTTTIYDPRCRGWYVDSKETREIKLSLPYEDLWSKALTQSWTAPVQSPDGSTFYGVAGLDIIVSELVDSLVSLQVSELGYAYMVDSDGVVVAHPGLESGSANIRDLEFGSGSRGIEEWADFEKNILNVASDQDETEGTFERDGDLWFVAAAQVPTTGYIVFAVSPEADVLAAPRALASYLIFGGITGAGIFAVSYMIMGWCLFSLVSVMSNGVTKPINSMRSYAEDISSGGSLSASWEALPSQSPEMAKLQEDFDNVVTALRFGSSSLDLSLEERHASYKKALALFLELGSDRGIGVCQNNLGLSYSEMGKAEASIKAFDEAIQLGGPVSTHSGFSRRLNKALALSRLSNDDSSPELRADLQTLLMEMKESPLLVAEPERKAALDSLEVEMALHEDVDKGLRLAHSFGFDFFTIGGLLLSVARFDRDDHHEAQQAALEQILMMLTSSPNLPKLKKSQALGLLNQLNALPTHPDGWQGGAVEDALNPKKVMQVVLDVSGSMNGSRIQTSIKNIIKIVDNYLGDLDSFGLSTFSTKVRCPLPISQVGSVGKETIRQTVAECRANGMTSFWDAIGEVSVRVNDHPASSGTKWMVVLTDGGDSSSKLTGEELGEQLKKKGAVAFNMIVITVFVSSHTQNSIRVALESAVTSSGCKYMQIDVQQGGNGMTALDEAFAAAASVMVGGPSTNVESF